ncbi:2-amino-4-hydroxy-6-hydroxymethyldihydropteridine diphosphokinase [Desulfobotulus sp. H1]|uniref:2-amino-4-hydroxy-6-hydroxymethyldihydropteridine pyrophosphokinase n=1 Tax=Desulfobotulus pelophilus TaxID=2823377 RepID=A0ABT3N8H7_9BACT|nr:2-amino-4-hydroxy-6-hydroxymethyldihydropteridine diphosphokinase [Desulfobotulus pelophilus]MCW7753761.1 2-amino-4-hydroxy-6-hydroxymethyldihydropteridine diphosphokinase [Desulfobotulus pelophilus]
MKRAWISMGANLGNPEKSLTRVLEKLHMVPDIILEAVSPFYRTAPVDYENQPFFVNAAVRVRTTLIPEDLLACLLRLQAEAGQKEKVFRYGPRMLDLDLLLYESSVHCSDTLILPHPRFHRRRFVLRPLCDIDPDMIHPLLHESMQELLQQLPANSQWVERILCPASLLP